MTSWLVSSQQTQIPGHILLKSFNVVYEKLGVDVWKHPEVQTDKEHSYALLNCSTTFGVSDVYFLACMYGLVEVYQDELASLSKHTIHTKKGEQITCQAIVKCLGSECDPE